MDNKKLFDLSQSVSVGYYSSGDKTTLVQTLVEIGVKLAENLSNTKVVIIDTDPHATLTLQWMENEPGICIEMQTQDPKHPLSMFYLGPVCNLYNILSGATYVPSEHYKLFEKIGGSEILKKYNEKNDNLLLLPGSVKLSTLELQYMYDMTSPDTMPAFTGSSKIFKSLLDSMKVYYNNLGKKVIIMVPICGYPSFVSSNIAISCEYTQVLVGKYESDVIIAGNFLRTLHSDCKMYAKSHSVSEVIGIDISTLSCDIVSNQRYQKSLHSRLFFKSHPNIESDDSWAKMMFDNLVSHFLFPNFGKGGIIIKYPITTTTNATNATTTTTTATTTTTTATTINAQEDNLGDNIISGIPNNISRFREVIESLLMIANFETTNLDNINPQTICDESKQILSDSTKRHYLERYIHCLISRIPGISNIQFRSSF